MLAEYGPDDLGKEHFVRTPTWLAVLVAALGIPLTVSAEPVRVLEARPYFEEIRVLHPELSCDTIRGPTASRDRRAQWLGGLAGGYLGSQVGSGRGREVATVAGALYGAHVARHHRSGGDGRQDCREITSTRTERRVAGYDVIYARDGRLWRTRMTQDPGPTLHVVPRHEEDASHR